MKSTIPPDMAVMRSFAREQFGKRMRIGYYSGRLMYKNLYREQDFEMKYGE